MIRPLGTILLLLLGIGMLGIVAVDVTQPSQEKTYWEDYETWPLLSERAVVVPEGGKEVRLYNDGFDDLPPIPYTIIAQNGALLGGVTAGPIPQGAAISWVLPDAASPYFLIPSYPELGNLHPTYFWVQTDAILPPNTIANHREEVYVETMGTNNGIILEPPSDSETVSFEGYPLSVQFHYEVGSGTADVLDDEQESAFTIDAKLRRNPIELPPHLSTVTLRQNGDGMTGGTLVWTGILESDFLRHNVQMPK